jgi:acetyltransferase-like isoleucine patch superfamily enzyme
MQLFTEDNYVGFAEEHRWAPQFAVLAYADGATSTIPHGFFCDWLGAEPSYGQFHIGRCSGLGIGSTAKYDSDRQCLRVGRYVAGGTGLRFILNGQHEMRTISTSMFGAFSHALRGPPIPQYGDTVIKNDVWLGDEVMVLGGATIENGCVIGARALLPANFRSEPYGIYAGVPAKLLRYRFTEKVRAALLDLAWWEMPMAWMRENNAMFLEDLCADETRALLLLDILRASRLRWEAAHGPVAP